VPSLRARWGRHPGKPGKLCKDKITVINKDKINCVKDKLNVDLKGELWPAIDFGTKRVP